MPNSVEKRAIKIVMKYERHKGRKPVDMSDEKCGYDVRSVGRFIEVKGLTDKRPTFAEMQDTLLRKLGKDIAHYYIYTVYDIKGSPKLKIMEPEDIFKNMTTIVKLYIPASAINEHGKDVRLKPVK